MKFDYLQWLRFTQVIVGKQGRGLDVRAGHDDGLQITFTVEKTIRHTPNTADVTIYNLAPDDEHLCLKEYDEVIINAGYARSMPKPGEALDPSKYAVFQVFRGALKHAVANWEKGDRKVTIQAADGIKDYKHAILNTFIEAGRTDADVVAAALQAMPNTRRGHIQTSSRKLLRHKVLSGPAIDALHKAAANNDAHWSIQDGALQVIKSTGVLPTEAVVMNYESGLLESPALSDKGIEVRSLLNPLVSINGRLLLNNGDIQIKSFQLYANGPKATEKKLVRLAEDGVYKVYSLRHDGDSRGDATTVSQCIALGDTLPPETKKAPLPRLG